MIWGLSLPHGPHHVYRALVGSVCFGTENIIRTVRQAGNAVDEVVACGGALNSPLWLQAHADVAGLPIRTTAQPDVAVLGAAVLAAAGAGLYPSIAERPGRWSGPGAWWSRTRPPPRPTGRGWTSTPRRTPAMRPLLHRATALAAGA